MENILKEMTSFFKLVSDAKGDDVVFLSMMVDKKEENISVALSAIVSEEADAEIAAQDEIKRVQNEG